MDTRVTHPFADGDYEFWLPMPRIVAIERECARLDGEGVKQPRSVLALFHEIGENLGAMGGSDIIAGPVTARMSEVQSIIRHGLIGGASGLANGEAVTVTETTARDLVETYCYPARPAIHDLGLAWRILRAAIYGIDQGSKKKSEAEGGNVPGPS